MPSGAHGQPALCELWEHSQYSQKDDEDYHRAEIKTAKGRKHSPDGAQHRLSDPSHNGVDGDQQGRKRGAHEVRGK